MAEVFYAVPQQVMAVFIFIFGVLWGSFSNVVIYRCPKGESIVHPRSACPKCNTQLKWYDNIPLLSWLFLLGKCRYCSVSISIRYFIVEFLTGLLFMGVFLKVGVSWTLIEYLIFSWALVVASFIDLDQMILPDKITLTGIVLGLAGGALNPERSFVPSILGVLVGGGFLWAIAYIYYVIRKEDGMGGGDIKLLAWIGAVLGWSAIPFVILVSSLLGTLVGVSLLIKSKEGLKTVIPFGPYLAMAAVIYIFWGQELAHWYLNIFISGV